MNNEVSLALQASNRSAQKQALVKLYDGVEVFVGKFGIINDKTQLCQEFSTLLGCLGSDNHYVGFLSAKVILYMVKKKLVCEQHLLKACISQSALHKPKKNLLYVVFNLAPNIPVCESNQYAQSPLSRIYYNCQSSHSELFAEMHEFLISKMQDDLVDNTRSLIPAFAVFKPLIKSVISSGKHLHELVIEILDFLSVAVKSFPEAAADMFACVLHDICSSNATKPASTMLTVQKLVLWYLGYGQRFKGHNNDLLKLISLQLTCCWNLMESNSNSRLFAGFNLLSELLIVNNTIYDSCACDLQEDMLFLLAMMLLKVDENLAAKILQLVLHITQHYVQIENTIRVRQTLTVLLLPLLQILSGKTANRFLQSDIYILAGNILKNIDFILKCDDDEPKTSKIALNWHNTYGEIMNVARASIFLLRSLQSDQASAVAWLSDVKRNFEHKPGGVIRENITLTVAAILVGSKSKKIFTVALDAVSVICKYNSELVLTFIPLLLFCLNNKTYESVKLDILFTFPKLATDKFVIATVLKVILSVSSNNVLLSIGIKLLTNLWKEQPRVFPYLQQLLSKKLNKETIGKVLWYELVTAKVVAVLEICKLMPVQHGKDLVLISSDILEDLIRSSAEDQVEAEKQACCMALVVESLKVLCEAQVIDVQSIWKAVVLKAQQKDHPIILKSLCSLLKIVPFCVSETKEKFLEEVLTYLWFRVTGQDEQVISSAYDALSNFPSSLIKVKYLPPQVREITKEKLKALKENKDDEEYNGDNDICPGFGYISLLLETNASALPGFQKFIQTALQSDIDALPRGVGRRVNTKPISSHDNARDVLLRQYESSTRPGILPGLAAGLLYCYEPKLYGMDPNNMTKKQLKQLPDRYLQMLDSLLQDFKLQPNDWHHAATATKSWCCFMKKMYNAFSEGRRADLELQKERGLVTDEELHNDHLTSIKFWSRDQITNQLRKASKGSPKTQGNSILALVGLANAISSFEENESKEDRMRTPDQFISVRSWLLKVADTVMVVFDGNYKPASKPFQWCQQVSSEKSTASSLISRCCAAISLSELVSPLLSLDTERITHMVEALKVRCPGQTKAGSATPMHFYCGLGFGLMLSRLYQEQLSEIIGGDGGNVMVRYLSLLQNIVFEQEELEKDGAIVGYGYAVSSLLSHDSRKDSKVHGLACLEKLFLRCTSFGEEELATVTGQGFFFALAIVTQNAFACGGLGVEEVTKYLELLQQKISKAPQHSDLHHAIGVLCHTLMMSKHQGAATVVDEQLLRWQDILTKRDSNTLLKLGAVKGTMSTVGVEVPMFKIENTTNLIEVQRIKSLLKLLLKTLETSHDNLLCVVTAHLIGQSQLVVCSEGEDNNNLPQSYNYLKNTSVLFAVYNTLLRAATSGPYSECKNDVVLCLLTTLCNLNQCKLPPVNWTLVLSPILRTGYLDDVRFQCICFAVKFADSSSNLALIVSSWLQPNVFLKMESAAQMRIFRSVTQLLPCLTNTKQRALLEELPIKALNCSNDVEAMLACVLESWLSVLDMQTPLQSTVAYILAAMKSLFESLHQFEQSAVLNNMEVLAKFIYRLLQQNWKNLLTQISNARHIQQSLQVYMLYHVQSVHPDDIKSMLSIPSETCDKQVEKQNLELMRTVCELHDNTPFKTCVEKLLTMLLQQDKDGKLSEEECKLMYICHVLSSCSDWMIKPLNMLSSEASFSLLYQVSKVLFQRQLQV